MEKLDYYNKFSKRGYEGVQNRIVALERNSSRTEGEWRRANACVDDFRQRALNKEFRQFSKLYLNLSNLLMGRLDYVGRMVGER